MDQRPKHKTKTIKSSEEDTEGSFMTLNLAMIALMWHQKHSQKRKKLGKLECIEIKNLCIKGYYQENEKATHRLGDNIWKSYIW